LPDVLPDPFLAAHADPGLLRDVLEGAAALVAVQEAVRAFKELRGAEGPALAEEVEPLPQVDGRRPGDVVADEQVEPAVAVVVEERGRGGPVDRALPGEDAGRQFPRPAARPAHPGGVGHVAEGALAVLLDVAEEPVAADTGDEDVGPAVVVVV